MSPPVAQPLEEHRGADGDDQQPRGEREPGIQLLGDDELRQGQRDEPEREDARRVCDRDDQAERNRVTWPAAGAHEIPGDDRLTVTRSQCVRCAPEGRDQQRDEDDAEPEIFAGDQALEPSRVPHGRRSAERGRLTRARTEHNGRGRAFDVEGLREQISRVLAQLVARAARSDARGLDPRSTFRADDHLSPADARAEGRVAEAKRAAAQCRFVDGLEAQRLQPSGPRAEPDRGVQEPKRRALTVDLELQALRELLRIARPANALPLLEGGDLGEVEDLLDVDPVARDLDGAEAVDREVSEGVRERVRGTDERAQQGDEDDEPLHDACLLATGAHTREKCGLVSSALANQARAVSSRPRQRSIMPRWKNFEASSDPSRSARRE